MSASSSFLPPAVVYSPIYNVYCASSHTRLDVADSLLSSIFPTSSSSNSSAMAIVAWSTMFERRSRTSRSLSRSSGKDSQMTPGSSSNKTFNEVSLAVPMSFLSWHPGTTVRTFILYPSVVFSWLLASKSNLLSRTFVADRTWTTICPCAVHSMRTVRGSMLQSSSVLSSFLPAEYLLTS